MGNLVGEYLEHAEMFGPSPNGGLIRIQSFFGKPSDRMLRKLAHCHALQDIGYDVRIIGPAHKSRIACTTPR